MPVITALTAENCADYLLLLLLSLLFTTRAPMNKAADVPIGHELPYSSADKIRSMINSAAL